MGLRDTQSALGCVGATGRRGTADVRHDSVRGKTRVDRGEPEWVPIASTKLLYVSNTVSHVFKELSGQKIYTLISGRWFRSGSFDGPWEFVAGVDLPRDFSEIPDDSPKENVKASVPGTRQALEAVIANAIPSTVKVERKKATMDPPPFFTQPATAAATEPAVFCQANGGAAPAKLSDESPRVQRWRSASVICVREFGTVTGS